MNNTYIIIGLVAILSIVIYFLFVKKDTTVNDSQGAVDTLSQAAVSNTSISKSEADKLGEKALANVSPNDTSANKAIDNLKTAATTTYPTPIPLVASEAAKVKVSIKETAKEEQKRILSESLSPVKEKFKFLYDISSEKPSMTPAEIDKLLKEEQAERAAAEKDLIDFYGAKDLEEAQKYRKMYLEDQSTYYMKRWDVTDPFEAAEIDNLLTGKELKKFEENLTRNQKLIICPLPDKDKDIKALENILMLLNKDTLWDSLNLPDNVISECKDASKLLSDKYSELSKYDIDIAKLNAVISEILMRNISPVFARGIKPGKDKTEVETLVTLIVLSGNNINKLRSDNKDRLPLVLYDETNNLIKANPDIQIRGIRVPNSMSPSEIYSNFTSDSKPPSDKLIIARFKYLKDISTPLFGKGFVYDSSKPCSKYIN
jgi:hypothetical protein